ncbi:hypothetical protein ECP03047993_1428 [Escherichia coli P0304799.3]|nr:hypothetical protein ECP03047993_1428 [Escherichia coli P0304799.3]
MIFIKSLTGGISAPSEHQEAARKGGNEWSHYSEKNIRERVEQQNSCFSFCLSC